ncbi:DUF7619 domain-containing protein [Pontibacter diazotrophicus]|nr:IPT/TIG domain-containing protein [Pontibacter diazotrophicus]
MTLDKENNLYLTQMSRIVKVKEGKILLDFNVNKDDYNAGYNNSEGVYLDVAVDRAQFIYILNRKQKRIEKHDQQGKLVKVFPTVPDANPDQFLSLSLHIDHNDHLNIFESYNRRVIVYDADGALIKTIILADPDPVWKSDYTSIAFDNQNNIYLAEIKRSSWDPTAYITHLNREGNIIQRFSEAVMKESGFYRSYSLAIDVDKNGDVYAYNNGSVYTNSINWPIVVFSANGLLKKSLSVNAGRGSSIVFDDQNNMYLKKVSSRGDYILKYDQEQQLLEKIGNLRRPYEVGFDKADNLYILDHIKNQLVKYNSAGEEDKDFQLADVRLVNPLTFTIDDKGLIYILEYSGPSNSSPSSRIRKFDSNGNLIGLLSTSIPGAYHGYQNIYSSAGLAVDHEGHIYVTCYTHSDTHSLLKFDSQGKLVDKIGPNGKKPGQLHKPLDVTVDAAGNIFVLDMNGKRIQKFSSSGKFMQQYGSFDPNENNYPLRASIASDAFGNVLVATPVGTHIGTRAPVVEYYDLTGNIKFSLPINTPSVAMNKSGSLFATTDPSYDIVTVYETKSPREYNLMQGNTYHDENASCTLDTTETGLADILIKAEPGPYYGVTDAAGNYRILVGQGSYTVGLVSENNTSGKVITQTCASGDIHFETFGSNSSGNDIGSKVSLSPHLSVSVSSTRRRRCFESTTTVRYNNSGFSTAPDAKVYLQLPPEVELLSADKAYTRLPNGTYEFAVGDLVAGQKGTITIKDIVTCGDESVRGRTVCTRAWITPSNNKPTQPTPAITITGRCDAQSGMIRFVIRNSGTADMEEHELFRKFANGALSSIEQFRLAAGDSMVLRVPSMEYTWRLEADQPDGNGDNKTASVTVEACTDANAGTTVSSGLVNLMPTDDEEAEASEECVMITDSYDPNDKLVTPMGRTSEHYTPTGTALKYKIRFQNTGTDVAYRVVVVDTLSQYLDLSTLQVGAASHAHRFEVSGKGRPVLTWTFDNIMLPDSTSNEPGSHGYIQFSIKPKADLPEKTAVENLADIFFDFNSPVRTNTTLNRIYDMPPVVDEAVRVNLEDVLATPAIAAFEPAAGKFGTEVTITGKRFAPNAIDNKVYLNGKAATVVSATDSELRVLVPAGATTGAMKVVTPNGGATATEPFEVYQPPVLSGFSPAEGMVGQKVTLQGQHLQSELIEAIQLGNFDCEVINHSGYSITVQVPAGATTGTFEISTKGGEAVSTPSFVVWYRPTISSLSKESDIVGAFITITGENFAADKARNKVLFGQIEAQVLEATPQLLVVRVPEQAASGFITVETPGGQAANMFEVIPAPRFTAMQPARGSVGTVVEISGKHFGIMGLQDKIAFNGQEALVLEALGDKYRVRVPRGTTTGKVQIIGYGGKAYSTADFVVDELTPAEAVQVYPNPNSGRFTLSLQHADFDVQSAEIYDGIGRLIHTTTVDGPRPEKLELQIRSAKPGLYTLHIKSGRGMIIKKVTVL